MLPYDVKQFGMKLKEIRKSLKINQEKMAESAKIAARTIIRLENGEILPKLETLEYLSPYYNTDLIYLLIQHRLDDYSAFCEIKKSIEAKLDGKEELHLSSELESLNLLYLSSKNKYYENLIKQLILFIEAILLYEKEKSSDRVIHKLVEAIKETSPCFNLDNYKCIDKYTPMEIRILMNIALTFENPNDKVKSLEVLEFCINYIEYTDELYPILCNNLSGEYIESKDYQKALEYSSIGIQACIRNRSFSCLNILYYTKGYAEYKLNIDKYIESLNTSIYLCVAFKQDRLKNIIVEKCKRYLGVDLEP